ASPGTGRWPRLRGRSAPAGWPPAGGASRELPRSADEELRGKHSALGRPVVALEAPADELRAAAAELGGVVGHHRDGHSQELAELHVVEARQGGRPIRPGERPEDAERQAVVPGEDRRRRLGEGEELTGRRLGAGRVVRAEADERLVHRDAVGGQRLAGPAEPLDRGEDARGGGGHRDSAGTALAPMSYGRARAAR